MDHDTKEFVISMFIAIGLVFGLCALAYFGSRFGVLSYFHK